MTSHTPSNSQLVSQLKEQALAAVGRQGFATLTQHIDSGRADDITIRAEIDRLRVVTTSGAPPPELTSALRAPRGSQRLIRLRVYGRAIRAVINPLGYIAPAREHAVWIQICTLVMARAFA